MVETLPQQPPSPQRRTLALGWAVALSLALHLWLLSSWQEPPATLTPTAASERFRITLKPVPANKAEHSTAIVAPQSSNSTTGQSSETPPVQSEAAPPRDESAPLPSPATTIETAPEQVAAKPTEPAPSRAETEEKPEPSRSPEAKTEAAEKETEQTAPAINTIPDAPPSRPEQRRLAQQQAESHIRLELARHFRYPLLARKRGWQGEVMLAFQLAADGRIRDARIARSSGHGVLDRAALKALDRVAPLEQNAPTGITLKIPVIYRLEG
ncbi:MAG: energy transducer TonB [Pseudomonadota bacterium]